MLDFGGFREPSWEENGAKIDPKRHQKNDAKKKGTKMVNKTLQEPTALRDRGGPGPGRGPPFKAGQTPGADREVRLASPGRPDWPSRPDLT